MDRMVNPYPVLLFVTAISAVSLGRRDVTTVLNTLQTIDTQTAALTTSTNSWDGSPLGTLAIVFTANNPGTAIDTVNIEAATEAQFSSADTQNILDCMCFVHLGACMQRAACGCL